MPRMCSSRIMSELGSSQKRVSASHFGKPPGIGSEPLGQAKVFSSPAILAGQAKPWAKCFVTLKLESKEKMASMAHSPHP
eukprot:1160266-Pelagomonas_calceolata.AAC.12